MRNVMLFCLLGMLASCASTGGKTADNREWVRVTCSGAAGWTVCTDKSLALCPNGYDIANKEENLVTGLRAYEIACKK